MKLLDEFLVFPDTIKKHDKYCFIGTIQRYNGMTSIKNYHGRMIGIINDKSCIFYQEKLKLTTRYYDPNYFTISLTKNRRTEEKKYEPNFLHKEELIKIMISRCYTFELLESYFNLVNIPEVLVTRGAITNLVQEGDLTGLYSYGKLVATVGREYGRHFIDVMGSNKVHFYQKENLVIIIETTTEKFSYLKDEREYRTREITNQDLVDLVLNFSRIWFHEVESFLSLERM